MRPNLSFAATCAILLASNQVHGQLLDVDVDLSLSLQQIIDAIIASGAGTGNSGVSSALADLVDLGDVLLTAVETAIEDIGTSLSTLTDLELEYSYGHSPPVYPSPEGTGAGSWADAYASAKSLVAQMTDDEKNSILYGQSDTYGCSGFSGNVSRLAFPGICLNDAENGVRTGSQVNSYPAEIHVGASWNRNLTLQRAQYIGQEFKTKGINVILGPVVGPLGRVAEGGRNWEGFSNDPYLAGSLVAPTVTGFQESAIACVKHFIAYEQETNRQPFLAGFLNALGLFNQSVSSNLDDRTMHELYLWPWYDAIQAGAGSVMASYNRVNNSQASQNSKTMNGLLKTELGFQGFVVSDWYGQHTGVASANAGLDLAMPDSLYWDDNTLVTAVSNGSMNATRLDDMATRILAAWYRYAPYPTPGMDANNVSALNAAADETIFQGAVEGHVLVKNVGGALPLNAPKTLSLFGYDAIGGQNTSDDSIKAEFGVRNTDSYDDGVPLTDIEYLLYMAAAQPASDAGPQAALNGTLVTAGGSGSNTPPFIIAPFDAFVTQTDADGTTLITDFVSLDPDVDPSSDACVVLVNEQSSEGWDRAGLADAYSDELISNVASQCSNTIVVIHNAGIRIVDAWIENANITAVIFAHVPGQQSGSALTEIMYGRQSPTGRLPYTVGKNESDYSTLLSPSLPDAQNPIFSQSNFSEGVFIDYRSFMQRGVEPRYAFGYGLTYTNFTYSSLSVTTNSSADLSQLPPDLAANSSVVAPEGGLASLYDVLVTVTVDIANTGSVAAAEVAQLYLTIPNSGVPLVLRGFDKQTIQPGESTTSTFPLRRRDLSMWDASQQSWVLQEGDYTVNVGKSVADIQLDQTLQLL